MPEVNKKPSEASLNRQPNLLVRLRNLFTSRQRSTEVQLDPQHQQVTEPVTQSSELKTREEIPYVSWQEINQVQAEFNKREFEKRKKEVEESGLKEFYTGDFFGMQVFEGDVEIRDWRGGFEYIDWELTVKKQLKLRVRIIVSRKMVLPTEVPEGDQHSRYSEVNNTLFAGLYFESTSKTFDGLADIHVPEEQKGKYLEASNNVLIAITDQYEKINEGGEIYPLTIVYGHGDVDLEGNHLIYTGAAEVYPSSLVLDNLLEQYPPPEGVDKIPVILTSCNERKGRSATIAHPGMLIGYRGGIASYLDGTGEGKLSE